MAKRPYHVTVYTPQGSNSYIAIARSGVAAVSDALRLFPDARSVAAKPINTHRA